MTPGNIAAQAALGLLRPPLTEKERAKLAARLEARLRRDEAVIGHRLHDLDVVAGSVPGDRRAAIRRLRRELPEYLHECLSPEGAAGIAAELREIEAKADAKTEEVEASE